MTLTSNGGFPGALVCVAISLFAATSARADWQFTRWGMSPEEVVAASKGSAVVLSGADVRRYSRGDKAAMLAMPYIAESFTFNARFLFSSGKLAEVDLDLTGGSPNDLVRAIRDRYGMPVTSYGGGEGEWVADGDHVQLTNIVGHWSLAYFPGVHSGGL